MATVERATSSTGKQYLTNVLSNLSFKGQVGASPVSGSYLSSGNYGLLGFEGVIYDGPNIKTKLIIDAFIPNNFVITEAKILLSHFPIKVYNNLSIAVGWGYSRALKIYKTTSQSMYRDYTPQSEWKDNEVETYFEIVNGLSANGYTPSIPNDGSYILEHYVGEDIKSQLQSGLNRLKIESSESIPPFLRK